MKSWIDILYFINPLIVKSIAYRVYNIFRLLIHIIQHVYCTIKAYKTKRTIETKLILYYPLLQISPQLPPPLFCMNNLTIMIGYWSIRVEQWEDEKKGYNQTN